MCGICGFTGKSEHGLLKQMGDALRHRGPDGEGFYEQAPINLCSRRLSIVDPVSGKQPVHNEDGSLLCIFNGEIYNHRALRTKLEEKGHRFYTGHSDSEVLVHLYEEYGLDFPNHLNGMFAIALWDSRIQTLYLIRDRMGVKPLFSYYNGTDLIFASEIKSILLHPSYEKKINYSALYHYFSFQTLCSPDTVFTGIQALRPGTILSFSPGACAPELHTYWSYNNLNCQNSDPLLIQPGLTAKDLSEVKEQLSDLIHDAVSLRLLGADVEVGSFLSGGLDSSLITALASQEKNKLQTFCLSHQCSHTSGLYEKDADATYARELASSLHTTHHDYRLTPEEFLLGLEQVFTAFDQPFSGSYSTFYLSRQIARHVKCALSGDGADELFGSYHSHKLTGPFTYFAKAKQQGLLPFELDSSRLCPFQEELDLLENLYQQTGGSEIKLACQMLGATDELKGLFLNEDYFGESVTSNATQQLVTAFYQDVNAATPLNRTLQFQCSHQLCDQVLSYTDALSMANSLEVRSPFLDYRIVEFAAALPDSLKIHQGTTKYILKEAALGILPDSLIHRKKEGFIQPTQDWMGAELMDFITDILSYDSIQRYYLLKPEMVLFLLQKYRDSGCKAGPLADVIWNLVCFQGWCQLYL